jgi:hypothetical protein
MEGKRMKKLMLITTLLLALGCQKEQHPDWWEYTLHWYDGNFVRYELKDKVITMHFNPEEVASGVVIVGNDTYRVTSAHPAINVDKHKGINKVYFDIWLTKARVRVNTVRTINIDGLILIK